ncbi:MAG: cellulase family glycosylhydrolase [Acidimicrobiia bacterium]
MTTSKRLRSNGRLAIAGLATTISIALAACSGGGSNGKTAEPAAPPANGAFNVSGTKIYDPDGKPFLPIGANFNGPDWVWATETKGMAAVAQDVWKFNTARFDSCLPRGCDVDDRAHHSVNNDPAIVKEFTDRKMVVVLVLNQVRSGTFPDDAARAEIKAWWTQMAALYKDNPYVWFEPAAEVGESVDGNDKAVIDKWYDYHAELISTIRATGAKNPIVVNGTQWGQELNDSSLKKVSESDSAILRRGTDILKLDPNVVFDLHVYDQWGGIADTKARDARMKDYIDRVHAKGLALMIGETGGFGADDGTKAGNEFSTVIARGTQTAYAVAPAEGVGIIAWHAQPGDDYSLTNQGDFDQLSSKTDPKNLTWHGTLLWNLAKNPPEIS